MRRRVFGVMALAVMGAGLTGCANEGAAKSTGNPSTGSTSSPQASSGQATTAVVETNVAPAIVTPNTKMVAPGSVVAQSAGPSRGPEMDGSWYADPTDAGKPGSKLGPEENVPASVASPPLTQRPIGP